MTFMTVIQEDFAKSSLAIRDALSVWTSAAEQGAEKVVYGAGCSPRALKRKPIFSNFLHE
jgi:hypothetical protein